MTSLERGLFTMATYHTYRSVERISSDEKFTIPLYQREEENTYHAIDKDGTPQIGTYVKRGDCIIGKVRLDKNIIGKVIDASTYVKPGEYGTVDRVSVSNNDDDTAVMFVRIKHVRQPEVGDHFASRYAQIPTVCANLPEADIPWTEIL